MLVLIEEGGNDFKLEGIECPKWDNALYIPNMWPRGMTLLQESPNTRATKPKLLDQVRQRIRTKHYSIRTEQTYVQWIKRFVLFHGKRHPVEMGEAEIGQFLTHLAVKGQVAVSTQNLALNAILFLFREVLRIDLEDFGSQVIWAKKAEETTRGIHTGRSECRAWQS